MSIPKEVINRCPYMSCYDNVDDDDSFNIDNVCWFKFTMKHEGDTHREQKEHTEAIRRQIEIGVLQPNGMPTGVKQPPMMPNKLPSATPHVQRRQLKMSKQDPRKILTSTVAQKVAKQVEQSNISKLPPVNPLAKRIEQLSNEQPIKKPQKRVFLNKRK